MIDKKSMFDTNSGNKKKFVKKMMNFMAYLIFESIISMICLS